MAGNGWQSVLEVCNPSLDPNRGIVSGSPKQFLSYYV